MITIASSQNTARDDMTEDVPRFMNVKQVARYLHINEKKVYGLVREARIPATKVTGKWIFPRELVDRWLLNSSHGGLFTDRLILVGSDDPLLGHITLELANRIGARSLVTYFPTGTQLGLRLLSARRADIGAIHWGPEQESHIRHPALLQQHAMHQSWVLVRAFRREQGIILNNVVKDNCGDAGAALHGNLRWAIRQDGAGSRRFLQELLAEHALEESSLNISGHALSEREAAAMVSMGVADAAPGIRACATEFGLGFIPTGWEVFDLVLDRSIYFRTLFQNLLDSLRNHETRDYAARLGGYDLTPAGELIWGAD